LRILYLNPNGALGGAERALTDLIQSVRQARPEWVLELITGSEGDFTSAARALGISVCVLPFPAAFRRLGDAGAGGPAGDAVSKSSMMTRLAGSTPELLNYVFKLRSLLRTCQPDLVHSNGFKTHILAAWAAPRSSRVLWHVHDYVGSRPLMSRLMRAHAGRCDIALANSRSVARDLDSVCGSALEIRTVHNAVDLDRFNPCGATLDLDALSGLSPAPAGCLRVGLVATMARWKGHEVFLRALSMLPSRLPIRGYVVGGPIYETTGSQRTLDELRELAREVRIEKRVGFTGFLSDSAAAIRTLDIVVHASTQPEPFGLVVAEAMACGKPVVASNVGGVTEIVSENETALTHCPGDAAAMAACIERLAADSDMRRKLGSRGRRFAEARFDRSRLAREVIPIYESIAAAA
jgi:glycosyltransferase involved in cell wall biosynthesis